jgi:hypothetical protein
MNILLKALLITFLIILFSISIMVVVMEYPIISAFSFLFISTFAITYFTIKENQNK